MKRPGPAQHAVQTARRKEIYEALHPETAHGGDRASRQDGDLKSDRFTDTAARTGRSKRKVRALGEGQYGRDLPYSTRS